MPDFDKLKRFAPMFSGNYLDAKDHWRNDADEMANVLGSKNLKFIGFIDGKPVMDVSSALEVNYFYKADLPNDGFLKNGEWVENWVFLGVDKNDDPIVAIDLSFVDERVVSGWAEAGLKAIDLRSIAFQFGNVAVDKGRASILGAAKALLDWHNRHGFCAQCGNKTILQRAGYLRKCQEENCGAEHFPRTDPVVIMLAIHEGDCLLGRSPHFQEGVYSALAGFMEPGETIEEAVKREMMEEAGLPVENVRYLVSQPWPFPSSLMIGCIAEAKTKDITIDGLELESARWFSKSEILAGLNINEGLDYILPSEIAVANILLQMWIEEGAN